MPRAHSSVDEPKICEAVYSVEFLWFGAYMRVYIVFEVLGHMARLFAVEEMADCEGISAEAESAEHCFAGRGGYRAVAEFIAGMYV